MITANIKITLQCDIEKVWNTVAALDDVSWRSDISKIEKLSDTEFVEYGKEGGYATKLTITISEPYERLEFDIENDNIKGHWIGLFSKKDGETTIDFTENVETKISVPESLIKEYLEKAQALYVSDLEKVLR